MNSIPIDVLLKIESHRPELTPLIYEIMACEDSESTQAFEKRLANAYMLGPDELTPEETLGLLACCLGQPYGEIEREQLH